MNHREHRGHRGKAQPGLFRVLRALRVSVFFLGLALLVGQQAVVLHDLGHAIEHKGSVPAEKSCDTHYLCAQLGSAVASSPPALPPLVSGRILHQFVEAQGGAQRTRLAYRSQAPPISSRTA